MCNYSSISKSRCWFSLSLYVKGEICYLIQWWARSLLKISVGRHAWASKRNVIVVLTNVSSVRCRSCEHECMMFLCGGCRTVYMCACQHKLTSTADLKTMNQNFVEFYTVCGSARQSLLTHWSRVTHICVGILTIIVSDNGLAPKLFEPMLECC